jgi:hypothetical protein
MSKVEIFAIIFIILVLLGTIVLAATLGGA